MTFTTLEYYSRRLKACNDCLLQFGNSCMQWIPVEAFSVSRPSIWCKHIVPFMVKWAVAPTWRKVINNFATQATRLLNVLVIRRPRTVGQQFKYVGRVWLANGPNMSAENRWPTVQICRPSMVGQRSKYVGRVWLAKGPNMSAENGWTRVQICRPSMVGQWSKYVSREWLAKGPNMSAEYGWPRVQVCRPSMVGQRSKYIWMFKKLWKTFSGNALS